MTQRPDDPAPVDLDDRLVVRELDPRGVLELVEGFPTQYRDAVALARAVPLQPLETRPGAVIVAGMGGSAAGGDFARAIFEAQGSAPFLVNRDYHLPNFVGIGDLVFCVSYSGDTEETLSAYGEARRAGARIVVVTSGGELKRRAEADGSDLFLVPSGLPPRTALGYLLVPILVASEACRLLPEQPHDAMPSLLEACAREWGASSPGNEAKALARAFHGSVPILYGLGSWQTVVANRWRCQINENAKQLAFANGYPELDHNEIMGWVGASEEYVGVLIEGGDESERMRTRARVTAELLAETISFQAVRARGESLLERMLSLAYLGDWVSLYLARLNGADPNDIGRIDRLKEELAAVRSLGD